MKASIVFSSESFVTLTRQLLFSLISRRAVGVTVSGGKLLSFVINFMHCDFPSYIPSWEDHIQSTEQFIDKVGTDTIVYTMLSFIVRTSHREYFAVSFT